MVSDLDVQGFGPNAAVMPGLGRTGRRLCHGADEHNGSEEDRGVPATLS